MSWQMPAEWQRHERTWMAWPSAPYTLGESATEAEEAYAVWAAVANAASEFEPLAVLVRAQDRAIAQKYLTAEIELVDCDLNDGWMRDIGPTFVVDSDSGGLGAIDWRFNGWGDQGWAAFDLDDKVAAFIGQRAGATVVTSSLVNEGGAIHTNGAGLLLATDTVQLGAERNPGLTRRQVNDELNEKLGTNRVVWLRRGLTRDYEEFGTKGHVDIVACFANENTILVHDQQDSSHPDYAVSHEVISTLSEATGCEIVRVPAPAVLRDADGFVDYSYINHYILNDAVLLCSFDDKNDAVAADVLAQVYDGREIRLIDSRALFARGGGIHCITQQQPKLG